VKERSENFEWQPGKRNEFTYITNKGVVESFMSVRAYVNGNVHCKFCIEFAKSFNVEAGRLLGWIHNAKEAAQEMEITEQEAAMYFYGNNAAKIELSGMKLLAM
jgi:hypothetical protein